MHVPFCCIQPNTFYYSQVCKGFSACARDPEIWKLACKRYICTFPKLNPQFYVYWIVASMHYIMYMYVNVSVRK